MTKVVRMFEWDAAHRVQRHESKCATLHGHRYKAEVEVESPVLDSVGRVVDFGVLKTIVGAWIDDYLDHTTILGIGDPLLGVLQEEAVGGKRRRPYVLGGEPTAEVLAGVLFDVATRLLEAERITVTRVRVWETPSCWAEVTS